MKITKCFFICFCIFSVFNVFSAKADDDIYTKQYNISGAGELNENLPEDTEEIIDRLGADIQNPESITDIKFENVFDIFKDVIKNAGKGPLKSAAIMLGAIILCSLFNELGTRPGMQMKPALDTVCSLFMMSSVLLPLISVVDATVAAIKGAGVFMLSFVPIYSAVVLASGRTASTISLTTLLVASETVVQISSFLITPMISVFLALSLSSSVVPEIEFSRITDGIRRIANWILTVVLSVFVGFMGMQTAIGSATDNLALKTSKFMVGSFVPVVGTALSETLSTVISSVNLLKTTTAVWGIIAVIAIFLPVIIEIVLWRAVVTVMSAISDMFSVRGMSSVLKAGDTALSFLFGILIFTLPLFIISTTVIMLAGGDGI